MLRKSLLNGQHPAPVVLVYIHVIIVAAILRLTSLLNVELCDVRLDAVYQPAVIAQPSR